MEKKHNKVAIIYYSYSCQTAHLIKSIETGLSLEGIDPFVQKIRPKKKIYFPFSGILETLSMMWKTFIRKRMSIEQVDVWEISSADFVILGGPTWSYNPSGPVLYFLDKYGELLKGKKVLPVISCRRYWRHHYNYLKKRLRVLGATCEPAWVFRHKVNEPWSTIGTFMTLAGMNPRHNPLLRKHYSKYGHSKRQLEEARAMARELAVTLLKGRT